MQSTAGMPIYNQHGEESCGHAVYTQLWPQIWNVSYSQNHTTHALQYVVHIHMYVCTDYKLLQDEQLDDTNDTPFSMFKGHELHKVAFNIFRLVV